VDRIFLEKSEDGDICRGLPRLWMLRFGLLLHDIGKGLEGVHEVTGHVMAKNISKRFGFDAEETSTLAFLVYRHMMMSQLAFRREPDSTLVSKACLEMKTIERCQLLYLLTRIDVENVGNNTWTEWKGILLEDVYKRCINEISSVEKGIDVGDEGMNTSRLINLFEDTPREMQDIWNEMMTQFTKTDAPQFRWLSYGEVQELTVVNVDRVGLCADMVSSLTCAGFDLLHAILNEQNDGIAVSVYYVIPNSHHRIALKERKAKVKTTWELISGGKVDSKSLMDDYISSSPSHPSRADHMNHENQVLWRHDLSREYTVCEISTRSRTGLLYQVAHTFAIHDIEVLGAKISTIVENAEDVFYLQKNGNSFEMDEHSALHLDLLKVISSP
jgi:[protein-PII] uridylyltransferase